MKTKIEKLNFNDLAFFADIPVIDAKFEIAQILKIKETTEKGIPKVGVNDTISVNKFDFTMKSNSNLEGISRLDYLVEYYSSGKCDLNTLRKFSETETFIKAIKFVGKNQILNKILFKDHLKKLEKRWLQLSIQGKKYWHKNTIDFIIKNPKATSYLIEIGISKNQIETQIKYYQESKNKKSKKDFQAV